MIRPPYPVLYLDPPWSYDDPLPGPGRGSASHYTVLDDKALLALPVARLTAPDCALFLWATGARLDLAFECLKAWGFSFVTVAFDWVKTTSAGEAMADLHALLRRDWRAALKSGKLVPLLKAMATAELEAFGMGRWTRSAHEFVLLGRRGKPSRVSASVRQTVRARPLEHSAKPPEVRERIVELMGNVPRLELFARDCAEGWDATGLEYDGRDIVEVLDGLEVAA